MKKKHPWILYEFNIFDKLVLILFIIFIIIVTFYPLNGNKTFKDSNAIGKMIFLIGIFVIFYFAIRNWLAYSERISKYFGFEKKKNKK